MNKIHLSLAIHNHQPVGNFDWVFENATQLAYEPMIAALERHPGVRLALHYYRPAARLAVRASARIDRPHPRAGGARPGRNAHRRLLRADPHRPAGRGQNRPGEKADRRRQERFRLRRHRRMAGRARVGTAPAQAAGRSRRAVHHRGRHSLQVRRPVRRRPVRLLCHRRAGLSPQGFWHLQAPAVYGPVGHRGKSDRMAARPGQTPAACAWR